MRVDVFATHQDLEKMDLGGRTVVVIDTLRATSSIIAALAQGCKQVVPVRTPHEAKILSTGWPKEKVLLGGEDKGESIEGFTLGNSPTEYAEMDLRGKTLFLATTNGTVALEQASEAAEILVGALLNVEKVAACLAEKEEPLALCCAGTRGRFSLEDTLTAGAILERLQDKKVPLKLCDLGIAALRLYSSCKKEMKSLVASNFFGRLGCRQLEEKELDFCMQVDAYSILPHLNSGRIVIRNS